MTAVAFTINGKAVSVEAEPDTALLWVVRELLRAGEFQGLRVSFEQSNSLPPRQR